VELPPVAALDAAAMAAADVRQALLTKPPGAMGRLEGLGTRLAGVCRPPLLEPVAVAVFAGDHGVHRQGVTPWPQEVTGQMVANRWSSTGSSPAPPPSSPPPSNRA
jgi:nicotinate-nucleotide--dimethylbenzimidazole phosphoribosyltransferase